MSGSVQVSARCVLRTLYSVCQALKESRRAHDSVLNGQVPSNVARRI